MQPGLSEAKSGIRCQYGKAVPGFRWRSTRATSLRHCITPPRRHDFGYSRRMDVGAPDLLAVFAGALVGLILGVIGGGGSILAVPPLVYVVGVKSPHVAIGTSAIAVAVSAFANLIEHARRDHVCWPAALLFAITGVAGAALGS